MVVSQLANSLVWDATHQMIYLSVPSLAAANGNSLVALDPTTGAIQSAELAGSEPDMLAVSDDDQYLYVALDGSSSVQRFTLPALTPDISYSLGAFSIFGPTFAVDVQVAPGLPHTSAVSRGAFNVSPYALGGMVIYDDATALPTIADAAGPLYDSLQWVSGTSIFANNSEVTSSDLYAMTVSGSGVVQSADYSGSFPGFGTTIHYDSGTSLLYGDDGYVVNPATGQQVSSFAASGLMIPDSTLNTASFLGQTAQQAGTQNFAIEAFDLTTFAPLAEITIANVQGNPLHFIRWGANGVAFNDAAGFIYILANPFPTNSAQSTLASRFLMPVHNTRSTRRVVRASKALPTGRMMRNSKTEVRTKEVVVNNPTPAISSLSPNTVAVGASALTLTVTGSNFVSLSTIEWNGTALPTELVSSTELQAQVGSEYLTGAGTATVTVVTEGPGGGTCNGLTFTVASQTGNLPSISTLLPNNAAAGSPAFTLTVLGGLFGGNLSASSVINWNGSPLPTQLVGAQLQAQVSAADIANPGYAAVTVSNPGAGGGTSNAVPFQILYQPTIVNQVTNDMVWDPLNQVFYISVPSTASANANDVCILNPTNGSISNCQMAGNNPDRPAISDDSQFLYVGEDGTGTVQRLLLPGLTPDISFTLGTYPLNGSAYYALDLQVAPGMPHTTAVSKGLDLDPAADGGVTIYDDATPRPTSAAGFSTGGKPYDSLQWGADATVLYAADTETMTTGFDFYTLP
jgi:trimeric autotransporter adhesin